MKLTPSKALKEIGLLKENGCYIKSTVEYKIVETALKDYEYLKLVAKPLTDEEKKSINSVARRLKALEIVKDIFDFDFIQIKIDNTILYNMRMTNKITHYVQNIDIKTKEQFDLLKEVLK